VTEIAGSSQPPLHITIVSETFPPEINGVANTLRYLCLGLRQRGHRVTVIRPRQSHEGRGQMRSPAGCLADAEHLVTGIPLPGYSGLRFGVTRVSRLLHLWRQQRPDTIYVATQGPLGVAAVTAARRLGIPVSSGFHTNFHHYSRYYGAGFLEPVLCAYGRWFHNRTGITLVPTEKTGQVTRALGIRTIAIWSRGVDCERFSPRRRDSHLRAQWGLGNGGLAVLYAGRLAPEKNLGLAVACYERIRALHPDSRFVLAGDGPLRQELAERHRDYVFCGMQEGEALARHYASADLFLFPSKTDTFGNVVLEAMASGLAVVAFDDAAASEHIHHERNGMKAALADDEGFVSCALQLADQPSLLARIRARARLDALDLDWPGRVEQFERLILLSSSTGKHHASHKQSLSPF